MSNPNCKHCQVKGRIELATKVVILLTCICKLAYAAYQLFNVALNYSLRVTIDVQKRQLD
jgi:hypothetical protein